MAEPGHEHEGTKKGSMDWLRGASPSPNPSSGSEQAQGGQRKTLPFRAPKKKGGKSGNGSGKRKRSVPESLEDDPDDEFCFESLLSETPEVTVEPAAKPGDANPFSNDQPISNDATACNDAAKADSNDHSSFHGGEAQESEGVRDDSAAPEDQGQAIPSERESEPNDPNSKCQDDQGSDPEASEKPAPRRARSGMIMRRRTPRRVSTYSKGRQGRQGRTGVLRHGKDQIDGNEPTAGDHENEAAQGAQLETNSIPSYGPPQVLEQGASAETEGQSKAGTNEWERGSGDAEGQANADGRKDANVSDNAAHGKVDADQNGKAAENGASKEVADYSREEHGHEGECQEKDGDTVQGQPMQEAQIAQPQVASEGHAYQAEKDDMLWEGYKVGEEIERNAAQIKQACPFHAY